MNAQTPHGMPSAVRPPAVAGMFYPGDAGTLARSVKALLDAAPAGGPRPRALIVPHAGYVYSGAVAARAYARLAPLAGSIRRVVLLGPSHRVALRGMAAPSVEAFDTPLGRVPLERTTLDALAAAGDLQISDAPHAGDHALEVQLPFLQAVLPSFSLLPIAVGPCAPDAVARVLEQVWGGDETVVVVSSDLSHFHAYDEARAIDRATTDAVLRLEASLTGDRACGCHAVNGLLAFARRHSLGVELLDCRNSGDTAGGRERVVGYASFAFSARETPAAGPA